jgi:hypothetical protein
MIHAAAQSRPGCAGVRRRFGSNQRKPMARIPYVESENAHWLTREILARRNNRNIHRMLGHSGPLADAFVRLATTLRYESELDPALREIAILRVGVLSGAT